MFMDSSHTQIPNFRALGGLHSGPEGTGPWGCNGLKGLVAGGSAFFQGLGKVAFLSAKSMFESSTS